MRESSKLSNNFEMFEKDHFENPQRIILRQSVLDKVTPDIDTQFLMLKIKKRTRISKKVKLRSKGFEGNQSKKYQKEAYGDRKL